MVVASLLLLVGFRRPIRKWGESLRYERDEKTLRVHQRFELYGIVLYNSEAEIPLRRITDVNMEQGPILHYLDIFNLSVQTAGQGWGGPEAVIYGPKEPREVKEILMEKVNASASQS
jgi:membrane protein YdbS with pleckstrin-like domain